MSEAVKTRHINIRFKPRTPARVINSIKRQYANYIDDDDELIDISTTDWYREMDKKMKPCDYLSHLRDAHGLSQKVLGEKIGTNAAHVSDFETGQRAISKAIAKKLAEVFSVSPAVFI
jgi:DNA-binding transcriptional regulator YiaG